VTKRKPPVDAAKLAEDTKRFIIAYAEFTNKDVVVQAPKWAEKRLAELAIGKLPPLASPSPVQELDAYTREHRNTVRLIEHLRRIASGRADKAPTLDPVLATLIADALEQGWKKRPFTAIGPDYLRGLFQNTKAMLEAEDHNVQILARELARELGATLTEHEMTKAAMVIAAHLVGLDGPYAFDGRLYPRTGRGKKG
jgi:hypothetical protein